MGIDWAMAEEDLAERLADLTLAANRYLIIEAGEPPYYVQFAFDEDGSIYHEAVSNTFLGGDARLDPGQEAKLLMLGWQPPGTGRPACTCCDPSPPNFHRRWQPWQGWSVMAQATLVTLRCVYRVRQPDELTYKEVPY